MSRAVLILGSDEAKGRAMGWIARAAPGTRVEFKAPKRTLPQNDRMWAMLTDLARQKPTHNGVKMTPDLWKAVLMQACGHEVVMLPTLDGDGFFPMGHRSSELSVGEMSELIEFMFAYGAREGIAWSNEESTARAEGVPNKAPSEAVS